MGIVVEAKQITRSEEVGKKRDNKITRGRSDSTWRGTIAED